MWRSKTVSHAKPLAFNACEAVNESRILLTECSITLEHESIEYTTLFFALYHNVLFLFRSHSLFSPSLHTIFTSIHNFIYCTASIQFNHKIENWFTLISEAFMVVEIIFNAFSLQNFNGESTTQPHPCHSKRICWCVCIYSQRRPSHQNESHEK